MKRFMYEEKTTGNLYTTNEVLALAPEYGIDPDDVYALFSHFEKILVCA